MPPSSPELLQMLSGIPPFADESAEFNAWFLAQCSLREVETGGFMFEKDRDVEHMQVLLQGLVRIEGERSGERVLYGLRDAGYITGVLPFSRMKKSGAWGIALEPLLVLEFPKSRFRELEDHSYAVMQFLVGLMTNRVRDFAASQFQQEKLMALGKISAGLAHELNNPASAMVRGAQALREHLSFVPERFKRVTSLRLPGEVVDELNAILGHRMSLGSHQAEGLSLMQRTGREDELADLLTDLGCAEAYDMAPVLVEFGFDATELLRVQQLVGDDKCITLEWLTSVLTTEKMVFEIGEAANRISSLISAIKSYSHMDRGQGLETVNVKEGLRNTLTILNHKLKQKNARVELDVPPDLPSLNAVAGQLNQVWTNLLDNAIDALPPTGGQLNVSAAQRNGELQVEICDNGHGIPPDILSRIFDPFFTTKGVGEGTGLGLDVVQRIVNAHKGRIEVESVPGKTVFRVSLPANLSAVAPTE